MKMPTRTPRSPAAFTAASPRLLVAALALSLGVSAAALAMPAGGDGHRHGHHAAMPGAHGGLHGMHGMRGLSALRDELKLDAQQEALWNEAVTAGRQTMAGMHERLRKEREETVALLSQPGADLRALARRTDETRAEAQQQHAAARESWLAVYDALSPEQKEKARVFFKNRLERMGQAHKAPRAERAPRQG